MSEDEIKFLISDDAMSECTCNGMSLKMLKRVHAGCREANNNPQTYSVQDKLTQIVFGDLIERSESLAARSSTQPLVPKKFIIPMFDGNSCVVENILSETTVRKYMIILLVHVIRERVETMKKYNAAECDVVKRQIEIYSKSEFANSDKTVETLLDKYFEVSGKKLDTWQYVFNFDQFLQHRKWITATLYEQDGFQKTVFHGTPAARQVAQDLGMLQNPGKQRVSLLNFRPEQVVQQLYCADETIAGPYGYDATTGRETMVVMTLFGNKRDDMLQHNSKTNLTTPKIVQMMRRTITSYGPGMKSNADETDVFGIECPRLFCEPMGIMTTQTVNETDIENSNIDAGAMFNAIWCLIYLSMERDNLLLLSKQSKFFEDMQRIAEDMSNKKDWQFVFLHNRQELWKFFDKKNMRVQQFSPICPNAHEWVHKVDLQAPSAHNMLTLRQLLAELGHGRDSACSQKVEACITLATHERTKIVFSAMVWYHMSPQCASSALASPYVCKLIFLQQPKVYEQFTSRLSLHDQSFSTQRILSLLMLPKEGPLIFQKFFTKEWFAFMPGRLNFEQLLEIAYMAMHKEYLRVRELTESEYRHEGERMRYISWKRFGDNNNILQAWVHSLESVWALVKVRENEKVVWSPQVSRWVLDFVKAFCMQVVNYQVTDGSGHKIQKDEFVRVLLAPLIEKLPLDTQQTIALHFIKTDAKLAVNVRIKTAHDFSTIIEHDREKLFEFLNTHFRAMFLYITNTCTLTVQDCINLAQKYLDSQKQYSMLSQQHHDAIVVEDVPEDAAAHKAQNQNAVKFMHSLIAHLKTLDASLNLTAARLHFTTTQIREVCQKMNVELPPRQQTEVPAQCKDFEERSFNCELKRGKKMTVPVNIVRILPSELPGAVESVTSGCYKAFYAMMSCTQTTDSELGQTKMSDFQHTLKHQFHNQPDDLHFTFTPYERENFLILTLNVVRQRLAKLTVQNDTLPKKRKAQTEP